MISSQLEPEGIAMNLTPSVSASASSACSQSESEIEIDIEMMVGSTSSLPSPFGAKSLIKSTEMALNVGAKSLMVSSLSPNVVPIEDDDDDDDGDDGDDDDDRSGDLSDEMDPNHHHHHDPVEEDVPSLEKFMKEQNKTNYCCDTAIENCLACSMIPEDFVETLLCRMDKTLCTCEVTDWVENTSNFCGVKKNNKPKVLVDHDNFFEGTETESLTGSMCSYSGSLLEDDDEDEILNSIESEHPFIDHTNSQQKEKMDPPVTVTDEEIKSVEETPKEKKKNFISLWGCNTEKVKDKKNEKIIENVMDNKNEKIIENVMVNEEEGGEEEVKGTVQNFSFDFDTGEEIMKVVEVDSEKVIEMAVNDVDDGDGVDSNDKNQEKAKNTDEDDDSNRDGMLTCLPSCMYPLNIFTSSANEVIVSEHIADEVEVDSEKRIETVVLNDDVDVDDENNQEQEIEKKIEEDDDNDTKCDVVSTKRSFNMNPFTLFKSTKENMTNTVEGDKKNIETMLSNEEESKNKDVDGDDTNTPSSVMDPINLFKATITEDTTNTVEGDKKNIETMLNNEEELKNEDGDDTSTPSSMMDAPNLFTSLTNETISNNEEVEKKKKETETVLNNVTEDEMNTDNKDDDNIYDVVLTRIPSLMNSLNLCTSTIDNITEMIENDNKKTIVTLSNKGDQETDDDNIYDVVLTRRPYLINPINFCKATIDDTTEMTENDNNKTIVTVSNNGDQETASITDNKRTAPQLSPKIDNGDSMINNKSDTPEEEKEGEKEEEEEDESGFECVLQRKIKNFEEEEEKKEESKPFAPLRPKTMEEKRMIQPIVTPSPEIPKKKKTLRSRLGKLSEKRKLRFLTMK
jgi:hypothetical protein